MPTPGTDNSEPKKRKLVVIVPGITQTTATWESLISRLKKEPGFGSDEADWLPFNHGIHLYSLGHLSKVAQKLRDAIHMQYVKARGYDEIILAGHSLGGLMARQAYLLAWDDLTTHDWGLRVSRIVLFASINRGIDVRSTIWRKLAARCVIAIPFVHFIGEDVFHGSDFITNLRIRWIRLFGSFESDDGQPSRAPIVVQFVGSDDGIVSGEDSDDIIAFKNARPIGIPDAQHGNLHKIDQAKDPEGRYALIKDAFLNRRERFYGSPQLILKRPVPKRVVFVLHGIMSATIAEWVTNLKEKLEQHPDVEVCTPAYPYMSPFRFAVPLLRKRNIRNFQDAYTNLLAHYPKAEFCFIGHSNGTYMLGQSLKKIPGMHFKNVVLAGSVLPQKYEWDERIQARQVQRIRNDRAIHDVPVGLLCSALNGVFMSDIGTGGYEGFLGNATKEVACYPGGHGAAFSPENLDNLVEFALTGNLTVLKDRLKEHGWFLRVSHAMPVLTWLLLGALAFAGYKFVCADGSFHAIRLIWTAIGLAFALFIANIL